MRIKVELFGRAASQSGRTEVIVEAPEGATLAEVAGQVVELHPELAWLRAACRPARNLEYAAWEDQVAEGDQVSFIPPVSGGVLSNVTARVTPDVLDPLEALGWVSAPELGGVVLFSGNVRDENRGRRVDYLEYEAYVPMAEAELRRIGEEAMARWPGRIALLHRTGRLEIGESSVLVAAASAHRAAAFEACRYAIDTLKERVPIWKREVWQGGEVWIEGPDDAPVRAEETPAGE